MPVSWQNPQVQLVLLLALGHVLGDFVIQTRERARRKRESRRVLVGHSVWLLIAHAAPVLPFFRGPSGLLLILSLGVLHGLIDALKVLASRRWNAPLRTFLLDQAAHFAVLATVCALWPERSLQSASLADRVPQTALVLTVYVLNWNGASALVSALLQGLRGVEKPTEEDWQGLLGAGRVIGILERLLVVTLVWAGQWAAVGFVFAAKSVARFGRLEKDQDFAEVYLIGTMSSVLLAILGGALLAWAL